MAVLSDDEYHELHVGLLGMNVGANSLITTFGMYC